LRHSFGVAEGDLNLAFEDVNHLFEIVAQKRTTIRDLHVVSA
jgi:hypothetical protein